VGVEAGELEPGDERVFLRVGIQGGAADAVGLLLGGEGKQVGQGLEGDVQLPVGVLGGLGLQERAGLRVALEQLGHRHVGHLSGGDEGPASGPHLLPEGGEPGEAAPHPAQVAGARRGDEGLDPRVRRGRPDGHAAAEAHSEQAQPAGVDLRAGLQVGERVLDVDHLRRGDQAPAGFAAALAEPAVVHVEGHEPALDQALGEGGQPHLLGEGHARAEHHRGATLSGGQGVGEPEDRGAADSLADERDGLLAHGGSSQTWGSRPSSAARLRR
jgi:hypothetical protein